jgi:hypothetical protein
VQVDSEKRHIAMNVGLVADALEHAEDFLTAISRLMDEPNPLTPVSGVTAAQTGGRVDPKKNAANEVIQKSLGLVFPEPGWTFELYFTALTPTSAEAMKKAAVDQVRGTLDVFVMVKPKDVPFDVTTFDPMYYMYPMLIAVTQRLAGLRKQLANKPAAKKPPPKKKK